MKTLIINIFLLIILCKCQTNQRLGKIDSIILQDSAKNVAVINKVGQFLDFEIHDSIESYMWSTIHKKVSKSYKIDSSVAIKKKLGLNKNDPQIIVPIKEFLISDSLNLYFVELYLKDSFPIFFRKVYSILTAKDHTLIYDTLLVYNDNRSYSSSYCEFYTFKYLNYKIFRYHPDCNNVKIYSQEEFAIDTLTNRFVKKVR